MKAEKKRAMLRYRRLRRAASVSSCSRRSRSSPGPPLEDKEVCSQTTIVVASITAGLKKGRPGFPRFQRTTSADIVAAVAKKDSEETLLRRSLSEAGVGAGEKVVVNWWEERENDDTDDGEEFRQKIEAFIVRQMRFIEREEGSLLLSAKAASVAGDLRLAVAA